MLDLSVPKTFSCVGSHKMKIVRVDWVDPCFAKGGWMDRAAFDAFCEGLPSRSTSVGILAYQDEKSIVVLQSIGENTVADAVRINRTSVLKVEEIADIQDIELA